jgi:starch-binding outer membrane protein, SusD/RagB family
MRSKNLITAYSFLLIFFLCGCQKFLDQPPLGAIGDSPAFWNNEQDVRTYAMQYYASRYNGFGDTNGGGWFFDNRSLCDDFTASTLPLFQPQTAGASNDSWTTKFRQIRADNVFVTRMSSANLGSTEATNHWMGVARFWRAVDYSNFVLEFGKVPYYDQVLDENSPELFRSRDSVTYVMDKVLEDFKYAQSHVRTADPSTGPRGQVVNKWVVEGIMSRMLLAVGTTLKYDPDYASSERAKAGVYLQAAKDAAKDVMDNGGFSLAANYQLLCSSQDLSGNPEVLLFRAYSDVVTPVITHTIMFGNLPSTIQSSAGTKDLLDSYLKTDGSVYNAGGIEDRSSKTYFANRDPRLAKTFLTDTFYFTGKTPLNIGSSATGFKCWKFLDVPNQNATSAQNQKNTTDAPLLRLGEIMLNYIEACVELQDLGLYSVSDNDLDLSINKLRGYNGGGRSFGSGIPLVPKLTISTVPNDPNRDADVTALKWEVRRERRVELVFEGFRLTDLKRWRKLNHINTVLYPKTNLGAWLVKDMTNTQNQKVQVANLDGSIVAASGQAGSGYVQPAIQPRGPGNVVDRYYLNYIPTQEIVKFQNAGYTLDQNPGW